MSMAGGWICRIRAWYTERVLSQIIRQTFPFFVPENERWTGLSHRKQNCSFLYSVAFGNHLILFLAVTAIVHSCIQLPSSHYRLACLSLRDPFLEYGSHYWGIFLEPGVYHKANSSLTPHHINAFKDEVRGDGSVRRFVLLFHSFSFFDCANSSSRRPLVSILRYSSTHHPSARLSPGRHLSWRWVLHLDH